NVVAKVDSRESDRSAVYEEASAHTGSSAAARALSSAAAIKASCATIRDCEVGDTDCRACYAGADEEDSRAGVSAYRQAAYTGTGDGEVLCDGDLSGCEGNGPGDTEVDRVALVGDGDRVAERASAAVVQVGNGQQRLRDRRGCCRQACAADRRRVDPIFRRGRRPGPVDSQCETDDGEENNCDEMKKPSRSCHTNFLWVHPCTRRRDAKN